MSPTDVAETTAPILHLRGPILLGAEEELDGAWVVGGRIHHEKPELPAGAEVREIEGFVLPGLADLHCHLGIADGGGGTTLAEAREQALVDRDSGVLLIRDAGSIIDNSPLQQQDDLPRLIRCGRHLARTRRYLIGYADELEPEDLPAAVTREAGRADGWVKLVGDWIDRDAGDLTPCWPAEALKPAIDAAHAEGARVTAHCFGEQSLFDFADAGVDCIEHASGLTEESIALFAERDIAIVPTLVNLDNFPTFAAAGEAKFPAYAAHMRDLHARRYTTIGAARDAGIRIYAGTDAGGQLPHGLIASEVAEMTNAGMSNSEALATATWGAREWLGHERLTEGAPADIVMLDADPRDDVRVLAAPRHVVLRGRIVE